MRLSKILFLSLIVAFNFSVGKAHHGKDYVVTEGYSTPERKEWLLFLVSDYHVPNRNHSDFNYLLLQPGFLFGLTNHLALEFHSHLEKLQNEKLKYQSTALEFRLRFLEEEQQFLSPAISLEYERSASDEPDALKSVFILSKFFGKINLTGNLILNKELSPGEKVKTDYAFGLNRRVFSFDKLSLEFNGNLHQAQQHYLTPSFYLSVLKNLNLKLGASLGLNSQSEDFSLRTAWHFQF